MVAPDFRARPPTRRVTPTRKLTIVRTRRRRNSPLSQNARSRRLWHNGGSVEVVEPAQRVGRAVAGLGPLGVARLLRRAVAQVKARLVGARHRLQAGDPR